MVAKGIKNGAIIIVHLQVIHMCVKLQFKNKWPWSMSVIGIAT